jgi:ribonuclease BN (tRNA processing enzyme)
MAPPYFPVRYADLAAKISYADACPDTFDIGSVSVTPIPLSHPNNGSGYKFTENGKSFVFLTDNELGFIHPGGETFQAYEEFCTDADLLIHDAEFTPAEYKENKEWGHSVYTEAVDLALASKVKQLGLFHLNQDRSDGEMDEIVEDCRQRIAKAGQSITCFGVACDMTFSL